MLQRTKRGQLLAKKKLHGRAPLESFSMFKIQRLFTQYLNSGTDICIVHLMLTFVPTLLLLLRADTTVTKEPELL